MTQAPTPHPLLVQCWQRGITLNLDNDKLSFKAVAGAMTPALLAEIRSHKPALIDSLRQHPDWFNARPLSANERSLWFLHRLEPDSPAYNMAYAVRLEAGYSAAQIEAAFQALLQHHPILCSAYGEREGEPLQWLQPVTPAPLSVEQFDQADDATLADWRARQADQPLALADGEICRAALALNQRDGQLQPHLILVVHHIAADFISFEVLRQHFLQRLAGQPLAATADYSYQQWAAEQQVRLTSSDADRDYWLQSLAGLPQLQLPTDFAHRSDQRGEGEELSFVLAAGPANRLREQCRALGVTPYVWWLAAFQWFMARLSGQQDFVIGTPSAGRLKPEHSQLVGYLVNPLALRCQPEQGQSFSDWSGQVADQVRQALSHQSYPFASLVEQLDVSREAGRSPVFQHMFTLNHERPEAAMAGLVAEELMAQQRGAAHELNLVVVDDRQQFTGKWRYNNSLYRRDTVATFMASFNGLVAQLLDNSDRCLEQLSLAGPDNASTLQGPALAPVASSAWQAFVDQCQQQPAAVAVQQGEQQLSYGQLLARVEQQAQQLHQQGLRAGQRLGVCLERSTEQLVAMLASWRLGAAYVALDSQWPAGRLQFVQADAELTLIMGDGERPAWLADSSQWLAAGQGECADTPLPVVPISPDQPAYLIYTSGSTGQPKGVVVSQSNLVHYSSAVTAQLALPAGASLASLASNGADLGYTALYGALLHGYCLRLLPEALAFDADALADALAAQPLDCLKIVPSHLNGLLLACERADLLPRTALITGGEALSPELAERAWARRPQLQLFNHYGPTETTVGAVMTAIEPGADISLGQPLANVSTRVLDALGQVLPEGVAGELEIAGPTVAQGYLGQPEQTAERFHQHAGQRWYRTGDRVRQHNGCLQFIGRCDFQVKIRGYRVEPGEVESWLKQQVADAVVLNWPDSRGNNRLVAYLVCESAALASVQAAMADQLPDYMVPARWTALAQLPLLSNGKVDRQALPDPDAVAELAAPPADQGEPRNRTEAALLTIWRELLGQPELGIHDNFFSSGGDSILGLQIIARARAEQITLTPKAVFEHQSVAALAQVAETPYGKLEQALLAIARDVLGQPELSAEDNFFSVGGDSILSLQIIARARADGIALTPKQVFEHQSMAALAEVASWIETAAPAAEQAPVLALPDAAFPLTPIQQNFFAQPLAQPGHWNQSLLLDCAAPLVLDALREAVAQLLLQQPTLRLQFRQQAGQWQQYYPPANSDWARHSAEQRVSHYDGLVDAGVLSQLQAGFVLDSEAEQPLPLVRFVWLSQSQQLLCCAHHLLVDAISWQRLLAQLGQFYQGQLSGNPLQTKPEPVQFFQWQQALQQLQAGLDLPTQQAYWQQQSLAAQPCTHASNTYGNSRHVISQLPAQATAQLLGAANQAYNSRPQELMLTALAQLLGDWLGQPEITVELEGHGRETGDSGLDLSSAVGWFTSRYPQRLSASGTPETALVHCKEQLRNLPGNGLDYGLVRYLSAPEADWPEHSLVSFNYLGQQDSQGSDALFRLAQPLCAGMRGADNRRAHLLDINALVLDGQLQIDWCYPAQDPQFAELPALAQRYLDYLQSLLQHCLTPGQGRATAADFPDAGLTDAQLLDLLAELDA